MDVLSPSARRRLRDLRDSGDHAVFRVGLETGLSTGTLWKLFRDGTGDVRVHPASLNRALALLAPRTDLAHARRWVLLADPAGCPAPALLRPEDEREWAARSTKPAEAPLPLPEAGPPPDPGNPEAGGPATRSGHPGVSGHLPPDPPLPRPGLPQTPRYRLPHRALVIPGLIVLAVVVASRALLLWITPVANGQVVSGSSPVGDLWTIRTPAPVTFLRRSPWDATTWICGTAPGADGGALYVVDIVSGAVEQVLRPNVDEVVAVFGERFRDDVSFSCPRAFFANVDGQGMDELIVHWQHAMWYPNILSVFRRDGIRLGAYYHCGHLYGFSFEDLDGDGQSEILVTGTNNSHAYQGATAFILDNEHCHASARDSLGLVDSELPDVALARVIFPQFDKEFMRPGQRLEFHEIQTRHTADGEVRIRLPLYEFGILITLDAGLRPVGSVEMSDATLEYVAAWAEPRRSRFLGGYLTDWLPDYYHYSSLELAASAVQRDPAFTDPRPSGGAGGP